MARLKTNIVHIGNSQGIRIPKAVLKQCHLQGEVELEPKGNCLIIKSKGKPREGWDQAFKTMARNEDDKMLFEENSLETEGDRNEWEWE